MPEYISERHRDEMTPAQREYGDSLVKTIQDELRELHVSSLDELSQQIEHGVIPPKNAEAIRYYMRRLDLLTQKGYIETDWDNVHLLKTLEVDTSIISDVSVLSDGMLICDIGGARTTLAMVDPDTGKIFHRAEDDMRGRAECVGIDGVTSDDKVITNIFFYDNEQHKALWDPKAGNVQDIQIRTRKIHYDPVRKIFFGEELTQNREPIEGKAIISNETGDHWESVRLPEWMAPVGLWGTPLGFIGPDRWLCRWEKGLAVADMHTKEMVYSVTADIGINDQFVSFVPDHGVVFLDKQRVRFWDGKGERCRNLGNLPKDTSLVHIHAYPKAPDTFVLLVSNDYEPGTYQLVVYQLGHKKAITAIPFACPFSRSFSISPLDGRIYVPQRSSNNVFVFGEE